MKKPLFMIWAAVRWVPLMFLIAPVMEAPLVAYKPEPAKPIKTWVGNASWYGTEFNGRKTANGERFELVRINDRGPYQEGREIDVSYRVARKIGLIHSGVSQVRLELLQVPRKH